MSSVAIVVLGCILSTTTALTPCSGDCDELTLVSGPIKGEKSLGKGARFLGIPFAEPPLGDLRWQPPMQVKPWNQTKITTSYGNSCMQKKGIWNLLAPSSEDCLYLNMWLPPNTAKKMNLPIMLWFYGGSYTSGSAMFPLYNGDSIADLFQDTIVVVTNYRLNVFGFLGSEKLRTTDGSTGNFGLQDQRMAMKWCKENALAFNGDPNRITIFGESAGAGSVSTHMVMPKSAPYFHRAIMESGPPSIWVATNLSVAETRFSDLLTNTDCADVKCLRGLSSAELLAKMPNTSNLVFDGWQATIDGVELSEHPEKLVQAGKFNEAPVILGTNKNEGTLFTPLAAQASVQDYVAFTNTSFPGYAEKVRAAYPVENYKPTQDGNAVFWASADLVGDALFTCPARRAAHWFARGGVVAYRYFYEHVLVLAQLLENLDKNLPLGVFHGSEIPLVFYITELLEGSREKALGAQVSGWWEDFAHNGTLGSQWNATTPTMNYTLTWNICGDHPCFETVTNLKDANCDLWDHSPLN